MRKIENFNNNGRLEGEYKFYQKNGNLKEKGEWKNYNENNMLIKIRYYKSNKLDGKLEVTKIFTNDKPMGD